MTRTLSWLSADISSSGGAGQPGQGLGYLYPAAHRQRGGRTNTPCHDKDIELALGRLLQSMGGADNLQKALAILIRLRHRSAGERLNTPCNDKDIELTLARLLQQIAGAANLEKALAIYTRLRTQAAGGKTNIPCDDKEIELALGRHLQIMGGSDNLEKALAIYTRLRTQAAGGRANTPCDDKDIELALAALFVERGNWPAFDALRLEARRFPGFEPHLYLSIRYFSELLGTPNISHGQSRLLGKAMSSAVQAMKESGFVNASCISQLAHCIRLLSCWPDALLNKRGIQHTAMRRLSTAAKFLFDTADRIAPGRHQREKDQRWRTKEQELRALLSRPHSVRDSSIR